MTNPTNPAAPADLAAMLPAIGSTVVADNGRTYRVVYAEVAGPNTRRAAPSVAGDLGLVLDSKRAKTCYLSVLRTDGSVEIGISVGAWTE